MHYQTNITIFVKIFNMRDLIKQIMCLGMADILNKQEKMASRNTVIAGDPAHSTEKYNSLFELQDVTNLEEL